jgi:hypothetical protein
MIIFLCLPLYGIYLDDEKSKDIREKAKDEYEQKYNDVTTITREMLEKIDEPVELYFACRDKERNKNAFSYFYTYKIKQLLLDIVSTNPAKALHFLKYFTGFDIDIDLVIIEAFSKNNEEEYLTKVREIYKAEPAMLTYIDYLSDQNIKTLIKAMVENKDYTSIQKTLWRTLSESLSAYLDSEEKAKYLLELYSKEDYKILKNYDYKILSHIDDIAYLEKLSEKSEYRYFGQINTRIRELKRWAAQEKEKEVANHAYLEKKRLKKLKLEQRKAEIAQIDSHIEEIKMKERQTRTDDAQKPVNYKFLLLNLLVPVAIGLVSLISFVFHTIKN